MGQEIEDADFHSQDFDRFTQRLQSEMETLRNWFAHEKFARDAIQCGLELEAWLVNHDGQPAPDNGLFLATLNSDAVVPELSKFNFELNVSPQYVAGSGLDAMREELLATWASCERVAEQLNHRIVSIGILPTIEDRMLCIENMSSLQRYAALNAQVLRLRYGRPLQLEIDGIDRLRSSRNDLMLESAATSVQVHLKVPQHQAVRYYNASLIASALTVAVAANAPLLFGKRLWDDTRIAVFEQAVDTAGPYPRVTFGSQYLQHSMLELFEDNLANHRVLLPSIMTEAADKLPHVRMHNGTLWNWNRGLLGFEADGQPHLRIEHRPMSASPTVLDLFADMMLYLGTTHALARSNERPEDCLAFAQAKNNFYACARSSLLAEIDWIDGRSYRVTELLAQIVLPMALESLADLQVRESSISICRNVLAGRLETIQNGALWQRRKFEELKGDRAAMLLTYIRHQAVGEPVHTWN